MHNTTTCKLHNCTGIYEGSCHRNCREVLNTKQEPIYVVRHHESHIMSEKKIFFFLADLNSPDSKL